MTNALALATDLALERMNGEARDSYPRFVNYVLRDKDNNPITAEALHQCWHIHVEYCWQRGLHPSIVAPVNTGKTTQLVVGRIAFEIGKDPSLRVKIVSGVDDLASERVEAIAELISKPGPYRVVFPNVRPGRRTTRRKGEEFNQHEILLDRPGFSVDPTVKAYGVLSAGTGGRADLILFDDAVSKENSLHEEPRKKVGQRVDEVWMSRLEPTGRVLWLANPWHAEDHTHVLRTRPAWCTLWQPVAKDKSCIHQLVFNAPPDYPIPRLERALARSNVGVDTR